MPKISVIIPVYNTEKHLKKCLDSVLHQTLDDFEIIIINDGSLDNSQKIIDEYKSRYEEKIITLYQENAGQASARNNGISHATGEYISFVDSDDFLEPGAYEKAYNYASKNDCDIVCFNFFEVINGIKTVAEYTLVAKTENDIRYILNETSPCNKLIRRALFEKNKIKFTENRIYEDLELIPQLALYTSKIAFMDECLYNYVIHQGSTMRQRVYNPKMQSIYLVVDTLKERFFGTKYYEEVEFLYIEHLLHGGVLRFLGYTEGNVDIFKISGIMRTTFPKWYKNRYYKTMGIKYRIVCGLAYLKQIKLLKFLLGVKDE